MLSPPPLLGAASVLGPSHEKGKLPNQDAFAYYVDRDVVIVAVADGLGSKANSDVGARWAVTSAVSLALQYLHEDASHLVQSSALEELKFRILRTWRTKFGDQHPNYACTLLFVAVTAQRAVLGQLGDGLILHWLRADPRRVAAFYELPKEFSNLVCSLSDSNALSLFQIREFQGPEVEKLGGFLVMTDGVADDLRDRAAFTSSLLTGLRHAGVGHWNSHIDDLLRKWPTPAHSDDKTLVVVSLVDSEAVYAYERPESLLKAAAFVSHTPPPPGDAETGRRKADATTQAGSNVPGRRGEEPAKEQSVSSGSVAVLAKRSAQFDSRISQTPQSRLRRILALLEW